MCKIILTTGLCLIIASLASSSRLVCYYDSLAYYRAEGGKFQISDLNHCTHLIFAFSDINSVNRLVPSKAADVQSYYSFNALKTRFSTMVSTQTRRAMFIQSAITLLRTYGFDGLSLDWRFPAAAGSQSDNKQKFTLLCQVSYLNTTKFGGAFVWSLDLDDFSGNFCKQGKYPLISHLHDLLVPDFPTLPTFHNYCSGRADGVYFNPYNRLTFFHCVHGITYIKNCAPNLIFNPNCSCCIYP